MTQNSVSFSCQRKQISRCCINVPHEHSIKIGRRAWPTRDHGHYGEQSQKQLSTCWLNFRVRGQFEIKILIVRHINRYELTWACDHLKTSNLSADDFKNTWPRWVDTSARDTVKWYWSADTLFWQMSIDHNIDVQYACIYQFSCASKLAISVQDLMWHLTSACMWWVYGRSFVHYVITKFSRMDSLPNFFTHGALATNCGAILENPKIVPRNVVWVHLKPVFWIFNEVLLKHPF